MLVDGHNLIGQSSDLALGDIESEQELLRRLQRYQARTGGRVTVYFDPGQEFHLAAREMVGAVEVHRAGSGTSADDLIIRDVRQHGNPAQLNVVTSDRDIRIAVTAFGAQVIDSTTFANQLEHGSRQGRRRRRRPRLSTDPSAKGLSKKQVEEWLAVFGRSDRD